MNLQDYMLFKLRDAFCLYFKEIEGKVCTFCARKPAVLVWKYESHDRGPERWNSPGCIKCLREHVSFSGYDVDKESHKQLLQLLNYK